MQKHKMLIILGVKKFYKIDRYKYEIDEYKKKKIKVELHELVDFLYPSLSSSFKNYLSIKEVKKFKSYEIWKNYLNRIIIQYGKKNILIINDVPVFNFQSLKINFLIKNHYNLKILERYGREHPQLTKNFKFQNYRNFILNLNKSYKKTYIFFKQLLFNLLKEILIKNSQYFLVFGEYYLKNFSKKYKKKIIFGNGYDYNLDLATKKFKDRLNFKGDYAIFLESPTPLFKGDTALYGVDKNWRLTTKHWTSSLNSFFNFLERELNIKVVISAHPKVIHKSNYPSYYYGRRVLKTFSVINTRKAKLIITRMSTGASYGIINDIPVIYIYSDELKLFKNFLFQQKTLSKELGKNPININSFDKKKLLKDILKINKRKYYAFKRNYLTLLTRNEKNSKYLINLLNK